MRPGRRLELVSGALVQFPQGLIGLRKSLECQKNIPRELKPSLILQLYGTTEVVP